MKYALSLLAFFLLLSTAAPAFSAQENHDGSAAYAKRPEKIDSMTRMQQLLEGIRSLRRERETTHHVKPSEAPPQPDVLPTDARPRSESLNLYSGWSVVTAVFSAE